MIVVIVILMVFTLMHWRLRLIDARFKYLEELLDAQNKKIIALLVELEKDKK